MQSKTFIYLLRHGETEGGSRFNGSSDVPLSEYGLTQMWTAVQETTNWDRIISSPLMRCADFARALQQHYDIPLQFEPRIREIHFGAWEGRSAEELMTDDADALTRYWQDPTKFTPPQAEALIDFETRVLSLWREIIAGSHDENILLIAHGGVIRVLLCHLLQRPLQRLLEIDVAHATLHGVCIERTPQGVQTSLLGAVI